MQYLARGNGYTLYLTGPSAVVALHSAAVSSSNPLETPADITGYAVRMDLVGSNPQARGDAQNPLNTAMNYLRGSDSSQWHTDISPFGQVYYQDVYPDIDLVYYGNQRELEYDFIVQPGADPGEIKLNFAGASSLALDEDGNLLVGAGEQRMTLRAPVLYQFTDAGQQWVDGSFVLGGDNQVTFLVGGYEKNLPLVIDPKITYSTYLGGSGWDYGSAVAIDKDDNVYVAGTSLSANFPGAVGTFKGGRDAYVAKLDAGGKLKWGTLLGGGPPGTIFGFSGDTEGYALALDAQANVYVAGTTSSPEFPTTPGTLGYNQGRSGPFITKLSTYGTVLYSTYFGTSGTIYGVATDSAGSAYVTGVAAGNDFAPAGVAVDRAQGMGFVARLTPGASGVTYLQRFGGSRNLNGILWIDTTQGRDIVVNQATGDAYVTGFTASPTFGTTGGVQAGFGSISTVSDEPWNNAAASDAFILKVAPVGTVAAATYLGGTDADWGTGIALDDAGNVYVSGSTAAADFPVTAGVIQKTFGGGGIDAFVTKVDADLQGKRYSSFLGGASSEWWGADIAVASDGTAWVTGSTASANFPVTNPLQPFKGGWTPS